MPSSASFTLKNASGNTVPGTTSFNSTDTVATFTPTSALAAGTTYTVTISGAKDQFGQTMTPYTYTFTTSKAFDAGGQCPCTIWPDVAPSGATDANDTSCGEPGRSVPGHGERDDQRDPVLQGARQHRHPHRHPVDAPAAPSWPPGTFTNESTEGWEELDFSTPVTVTAGTTYVASYLTTTGHYADTSGGPQLGRDQRAADRAGQRRGLRLRLVHHLPDQQLRPGRTTGSTWCTSRTPARRRVTATTPGTSATSVPVSSDPTVTFDKAIKSGSATFSLTGPGGSGSVPAPPH